MNEKIFIGILFICFGALFFFNNKNIGKGAYKFYQKLYTERNLVIMFKIFGALLFLGGLAFVVLN